MVKVNNTNNSEDAEAPVVQTLDSAIHRRNPYSADKYWKNHCVIHCIYQVDSVIHLSNNWAQVFAYCKICFGSFRMTTTTTTMKVH